MLNSNKALHRELPGGAKLQLLHRTKYLSLNLHPYVSPLSFCIKMIPIPNFKSWYRPQVCPWFLLVCNITPPPSSKSSSESNNHTANSICYKSLFIHFNCWGLRIFWSEPTAVLSLSQFRTPTTSFVVRRTTISITVVFFLVIYFIAFDTFCCSYCGFSSNWILHYFPTVRPSVRHRHDISHCSHI